MAGGTPARRPRSFTAHSASLAILVRDHFIVLDRVAVRRVVFDATTLGNPLQRQVRASNAQVFQQDSVTV